jgi:WD40 repeat protein
MQQSVDENGEQSSPLPQQAMRRGISRRTALLGLLGLGGLAAAGVAISAGPVSQWIQKQGYPPGLLFSSDEFGSVDEAAWSPDGQRIAFGGSTISQNSTPGMIQIWNVFRGEHLLTLTIPTASDDLFDLLLTWSPDGKYLVSASEGANKAIAIGRIREVRTWNVETGKSLHAFSVPEDFAVGWALNTRYLAIARGHFQTDNVVQVLDVTNGHLVNTLKGPFDASLLLKWAPDGRRLAIVNAEIGGNVQIWDAVSGTQLLSAQLPDYIGSTTPMESDDHYLAWSPDGRYLAALRGDGPIYVFDTVESQVVLTYEDNGSISLEDGKSLEGVAWSSGKKEYFAYSSVQIGKSGSQSTISIYEALTNKRVQTYTQPDHISRLIWSPDGPYLAVAGGDRLRVWKLSV